MINFGFWKQLKKPVFVLAPMADVTDCVFRELINKYGKPDVFWTEFVAADGLAHPVAREKLFIDLKFDKGEHPIVAQIFGSKPENIRKAAMLCRDLGFDGIDINMGCPQSVILKQGAGAACIQDPQLAKELIRAAKESGLPVSVKTRIGYNKPELDTWLPAILEEEVAVLTIHLRTKKEMSDVAAHWELMPEILKIRDRVSPETLVFGNGDVKDLGEAEEKIKEYGCDGVMLGRAIFGNPWLFSKHVPSVADKLRVMVEHTKLFEKILGPHKNFAIMKKHYKAYVEGFPGAKELRVHLMEAANAEEIEKITLEFIQNKL